MKCDEVFVIVGYVIEIFWENSDVEFEVLLENLMLFIENIFENLNIEEREKFKSFIFLFKDNFVGVDGKVG